MDYGKLFYHVAAMYRTIRNQRNSRAPVGSDEHCFVLDVEVKAKRAFTPAEWTYVQTLILGGGYTLVSQELQQIAAIAWEPLSPYGSYKRLYGRKRAATEQEENEIISQ